MTDIVERLRGLVATCGCGACENAADEIERLRGKLLRLEEDWDMRADAFRKHMSVIRKQHRNELKRARTKGV